MPVKNYDNTLVGEYIRSIENPDSAGWNPYINTWFAPPAGRGYDPRNRGMGIDVYNNDLAKPIVQGRLDKALSEQEERDIRNASIGYGYDVINKYRKSIPASNNMSPRKEAETMGLIYRGDGNLLWKADNPLGKAYRSGNEEDFHRAVDKYYRDKGLSQRARNNADFWNGKPIKQESILNTTMAERLERQNSSSKAPWLKADGGSLKRKSWDELSMAEKSEFMNVAVKNNIYKLDDIKKAYNEFAEGGNTELPDEQYYPIMEKVAHDNWQKWGDSSEDAALERILNDNSYDYRGYYANNPQGWANAETHWPDTYKTYWHPTFSNESKYSGNKSQFNPAGADGGFWIGEAYFPADSYHQAARFNKFAEGGGMQQVIYKTGDGRYVLANDEEVTPFSMVGDDSSQWSYIGKNGRIYTPHREVSQGTITEINPFSRQAQELRDERHLNEKLNNPTLLTGGLYSAIRNFREGKTPMQALQNAGLMPYYNSNEVAGMGNLMGPITDKKLLQAVDKAFNRAKNYKQSPQYDALVQNAMEESKNFGFGEFPASTFEISKGKPSVVFGETDPSSAAEYLPYEHSIVLNPQRVGDDLENTLFHESLHAQGVGRPDPYIGDYYQAYREAVMRNGSSPLDFLTFYLSPDYELYGALGRANKYLKHKVKQAIVDNPEDKTNYLLLPGELQVNGLDAGNALGIEPFTPYPGLLEATDAIQKAKLYNEFLKDVKSTDEKDVHRFWDILTGQYTPVLLPLGVGAGIEAVSEE